MKHCLVIVGLVWASMQAAAQTPPFLNAADILEGIRKLGVTGSVLYIAAHPDDENTRLLAYLARERKYRTGYLSITRGDGGQNLIGDEQGIELGLIRTQELLAARRIDGAEQYFTTAYDFGFSKSTEEALRIWEKEKILSDVVWVIRQFQPDIIITRFPPDSRAGHGHHSASAVLAAEAFKAAADPARFPEHFRFGVKPWQAKRLLWNTFNFGSSNTTSPDQLKLDVGVYNPLLGKSYGEIASESRSQHKSQGFGVPRQRGRTFEYFVLTAGEPMQQDIMDGVVTDWRRWGGDSLNRKVEKLINNFQLHNPSASVEGLLEVYQSISQLKESSFKQQKLQEIRQLIEACAGLWIEATTNQPYVVNGDALQVNFSVISRSALPIKLVRVKLDSCKAKAPSVNRRPEEIRPAPSTPCCQQQDDHIDTLMHSLLSANVALVFSRQIKVTKSVSDPYWLANPMLKGRYQVDDQRLIGKAWNDPVYIARFTLEIAGRECLFEKPVYHKYTDPVKGELYQPLVVYPPVTIKPNQSVMVFTDTSAKNLNIQFTGHTLNKTIGQVQLNAQSHWRITPDKFALEIQQNAVVNKSVQVKPLQPTQEKAIFLQPSFTVANGMPFSQRVRKIEYDHIPTITYFPDALSKLMYVDVKIAGQRIGYINGAGDFVAYCLQQMGYRVDLLKQEDITPENLRKYDAIVTGIRAYNVNQWLSEAYDVLMQYVNEGGVLLVQYNTSNQIGPVRAKIFPLPFTISRNRVTEEDAPVRILDPLHPLLNYPNKITESDFDGWVQERSVYEAEAFESGFNPLLAMQDAGEPERRGSLIVANYGKGRLVYTALAFFRQLPAGVPGAYRIIANLLAKPPQEENAK